MHDSGSINREIVENGALNAIHSFSKTITIIVRVLIPRCVETGAERRGKESRRREKHAPQKLETSKGSIATRASLRFHPGGDIILSFGRNAAAVRDRRQCAAIYIKPDPSTIATFYSYTGSGWAGERVVARAHTPRRGDALHAREGASERASAAVHRMQKNLYEKKPRTFRHS